MKTASRRAGAGRTGDGHLDDAGAPRSHRRAARGEDRAAVDGNEAALKVKGVRFVNSRLQLLREIKTLVTSEGTNVTQTFIRVGPTFQRHRDRRRRLPNLRGGARAARAGWDYVESLDMPGNAERWASIAAEKLRRRASRRASTI